MGRKPSKDNENVYLKARLNMEGDWSREKASQKLEWISADKLDRIENDRCFPTPEEVVQLAKIYKNPELCNYFCSHQCRIGQDYVPEIKIKDLSQIVLEMVNSLSSVEKMKDRLVEITVDGIIGEKECRDFVAIQDSLETMSMTVEALQLWAEQMVATGKIDKKTIDLYKKSDK